MWIIHFFEWVIQDTLIASGASFWFLLVTDNLPFRLSFFKSLPKPGGFRYGLQALLYPDSLAGQDLDRQKALVAGTKGIIDGYDDMLSIEERLEHKKKMQALTQKREIDNTISTMAYTAIDHKARLIEAEVNVEKARAKKEQALTDAENNAGKRARAALRRLEAEAELAKAEAEMKPRQQLPKAVPTVSPQSAIPPPPTPQSTQVTVRNGEPRRNTLHAQPKGMDPKALDTINAAWEAQKMMNSLNPSENVNWDQLDAAERVREYYCQQFSRL